MLKVAKLKKWPKKSKSRNEKKNEDREKPTGMVEQLWLI